MTNKPWFSNESKLNCSLYTKDVISYIRNSHKINVNIQLKILGFICFYTQTQHTPKGLFLSNVEVSKMLFLVTKISVVTKIR